MADMGDANVRARDFRSADAGRMREASELRHAFSTGDGSRPSRREHVSSTGLHNGRVQADPRRRAKATSVMRRAVGAALVLSSLGLLAYPAVTSVLSSLEQHEDTMTVTSVADATNDRQRLERLAQARRYNAELAMSAGCEWIDDSAGNGGGSGTARDIEHAVPAGLPDGSQMSLGQTIPYDRQLSWRQDVLGAVEIPSIGTRLVIGHGTGEDVLASGAGHLPTSSLPVGGLSSHCVISGHSGMGTARMFDDLGMMREGDVFLLRVLGDVYAYRVYSVEDMVEPDDLPGRCRIEEGRDLCTLFTCTPYGINSHRLLVHGERIPYDPGDSDLAWDGTRIYGNRLTRPFAMAVVLGAALAAVTAGGFVIRAKGDGRR